VYAEFLMSVTKEDTEPLPTESGARLNCGLVQEIMRRTFTNSENKS